LRSSGLPLDPLEPLTPFGFAELFDPLFRLFDPLGAFELFGNAPEPLELFDPFEKFEPLGLFELFGKLDPPGAFEPFGPLGEFDPFGLFEPLKLFEPFNPFGLLCPFGLFKSLALRGFAPMPLFELMFVFGWL